jgi:hypothetical protein
MLTARPSVPALVDLRRDAEPDGDDAVVDHLVHGRDDRLEQRVLRRVGGRTDDAPLDRALTIDDTREDLRPAHVDADHALFGHTLTIASRNRMPLPGVARGNIGSKR